MHNCKCNRGTPFKQNMPYFLQSQMIISLCVELTNRSVVCGMILAHKPVLSNECWKFQQPYTHEGTLQKYYLTTRLKAEVTYYIKRLSGFLSNVKDKHKET